MGAYLSAPVTHKDSHEGENGTFKFGVACMQGWRTEMEDAHLIQPAVDNDASTGFFAVFDGHGGKEVAAFAAMYMVRELLATEGYKSGNMEGALREVFLRIDDLLVKEEHAEELSKLAAVPNPSDVRRRGNARTERLMNDADLPEELREVIGAARAEIESRFRSLDTALGPLADGGMEEDDEDVDPDYVPATIIEEIEEMEESIEEEIVAEIDAGAAAETEAGKEDAAPAERSTSSEEESPKEGGGDGRAALKPKRKRDIESETTVKRNGNGRKSGESDLPNGVAHASSSAGADGVIARDGAEDAHTSDSSTTESSEGDSGDETEIVVGPTGRGGRQQYPCGGCTAVAAVVRGNELYVANAGDSRCVFSRRGRAVAMTTDHKPTDPLEHARITKAGGFVADGRVNASLNLSRALGDLEYKQSTELGPEEQMVTAVPEIRSMTLQPGDDFLLLACDGIWDVLTNQEAVDFVAQRLAMGMVPKAICEALCDRCMAPDTETDGGKGCDNMSAMVVVLKPFCEIPNAGAAAAQKGPPAKETPMRAGVSQS